MGGNFSCTISFLVKFYWLSSRTFIFSMLESQSWKNKIVTKMLRLKRWWCLSKLDYYHHRFDFGDFFSCPVKLQNNLKLKFKSKFHHGFTIIMAIYRVLFEKIYTILILLTMGLFWGAAHGLGGPKRLPSLKYVLHILQWWHLAQLCITQRRSKKYVNHGTYHLSSADGSFSAKISKFCYTKKYRYRVHLNTYF